MRTISMQNTWPVVTFRTMAGEENDNGNQGASRFNLGPDVQSFHCIRLLSGEM